MTFYVSILVLRRRYDFTVSLLTNSSDPQIFDMTLDLEALQTRAAGVAPSPKGDEPVCEASLEEKDKEEPAKEFCEIGRWYLKGRRQ